MVQSQPLPEMAQFDNISKIENDLRFRKNTAGKLHLYLAVKATKIESITMHISLDQKTPEAIQEDSLLCHATGP